MIGEEAERHPVVTSNSARAHAYSRQAVMGACPDAGRDPRAAVSDRRDRRSAALEPGMARPFAEFTLSNANGLSADLKVGATTPIPRTCTKAPPPFVGSEVYKPQSSRTTAKPKSAIGSARDNSAAALTD
jgi:hypothetical protein